MMNRFEQPENAASEKQVIEGKIDDLVGFKSGDWKKILPEGIILHDVDLFIKNEGRNTWYWHLKSEHIKNEEERKNWDKERQMWINL